MSFTRYAKAALIAACAILLSACAQHGTLPFGNAMTAAPNLTPPDCKGQKTYSEYATLEKPLKTKGGKFCIPAFGGFGGTLKYPEVNHAIDLTLTSSVTNYDNMPQLGSGTPIFYLQFSTSGGVTFGSKGKAGGGLTGSGIVSGDPYTLYGQAVIYGYKIALGPCYATATQGKYGGVIGGFSTLLKGREIPFKASGVLEVYSGEQTGTQC